MLQRLVIRRLLAVALAIALLNNCGGGGGAPPPLHITADSPPAGTTDQAYPGYTFTASGGTPPLSWTVSTSTPPGLSLSTSGQLSGTPATAGTYAFSVTVSDSSVPPFTTKAPVSVKINDSTIVVAPASPPTGTVTYPYAGFAFSASGGSPPYTFTSSGALPPGLALGSDGSVSGTPTQAGSFSFAVTATDSAQAPVNGPPLATQIVIVTPQALTFTATATPPAGVVGTPYGPFNFTANGGYLPLSWKVTAGALPAGLTLGRSDGSLNGTPKSDGNFTFSIAVTDSAPTPVSISQQFKISVTLPLPPVINYVEPPTATVGVPYAPVQFTAVYGVLPLAWSETPPLTIGLSLSSSGVLSGTPTQYGQYPITINVADARNRPAAPFPTIVRISLERPPAAFTTTTGSMTIARSGHSATLLLTGKVLVAGGGNGVADPTAELYDPATQAFTPTTGNMTEARSGHTATLLKLSSPTLTNYGKVLIVGSVDTTAELYDPASSTFAATGSMHHGRTSPTATLLNTGKVLIVGGDLVAELYDPASGTFSDTGSTIALRSGHTATLLLDGHVLIAGGGSDTAELYDPSSGTFTATAGNMTAPRSGHTATLLDAPADMQYGQEGEVLIIGTDSTAELYKPATETFVAGGSLYSATQQRSLFGHTASLRADGTVLAAGGRAIRHCFSSFPPVSESAAALFAPESDGFTATGSLNRPRYMHTATALPDGTVLVIGGTDYSAFVSGSPWTGFKCVRSTAVLSSAELFR